MLPQGRKVSPQEFEAWIKQSTEELLWSLERQVLLEALSWVVLLGLCLCVLVLAFG